jgi:hypothetical protein
MNEALNTAVIPGDYFSHLRKVAPAHYLAIFRSSGLITWRAPFE